MPLDLDDVATQQHFPQRPQFRPPLAEVLSSLRHPDSGKYPCSPADLRYYISVCRDHSSQTPSGLEEVQQGPGVPGVDHEPLQILWSIGYSHQAHLASHQQSLRREILHAQAGAGSGTATAQGGSAATSYRCTAAISIGGTISGVHLRSPVEVRAPDAQVHAACDQPADD